MKHLTPAEEAQILKEGKSLVRVTFKNKDTWHLKRGNNNTAEVVSTSTGAWVGCTVVNFTSLKERGFAVVSHEGFTKTHTYSQAIKSIEYLTEEA